jgi:acyl-CoA thioester hydrolase
MNADRPVPRSRGHYRHFVPIPTRVADNDLYNHLNNATYYSFIDTAVTVYLTKAVGRDLGKDPVVYFLAETGCVYFSPIAFPDEVVCGLRTIHAGTSSMRLEIGLFRNADMQEAARGHYVQVCCDRATQRPIPMPDAVRAALEAIR